MTKKPDLKVISLPKKESDTWTPSEMLVNALETAKDESLKYEKGMIVFLNNDGKWQFTTHWANIRCSEIIALCECIKKQCLEDMNI
jgi:hypothetical protein